VKVGLSRTTSPEQATEPSVARDDQPRETPADYFPELAEEAYAKLPERVALRVEPPASEGGAMKLVTRGLSFRVKRQDAARGSGADHQLVAGGKQREVDGAWVAHQARDFLLLEGGQVHQARYEVALPEGVVGLQDTGETLDFLDASGQPVLRFHYPEARDAAGHAYPAEVRLLGAVPAPTPEGQLTVASESLLLEVTMDLGEVQGQAAVVYVWSSTASMPGDRANHLMARLPGSKALVVGGAWHAPRQGGDLSTAVVYDAASMTWSTTGSMSTTRRNAAVVELPDGRVLMTGGGAPPSQLTSELYNPASGTWSAAAPMAQGRFSHTATLLPDGRVLVVGGWNTVISTALVSAELYDPATNTWTSTGSLANARYLHTATLLKDGKVLVAGGYSSSSTTSAELYDPAAGTWSTVGSLAQGRYAHTATLLEDGRVLVTGGNQNGIYLVSCELFTPGTGTWSATGSLALPRGEHSAVRMPDGRVVVVSGNYGYAETEQYNPTTGTWSSAGTLATGPGVGRAALLLDTGHVLVTGGSYAGYTYASAELYGPIEPGWERTGPLGFVRSDFTLTALPDGRAVTMGGSTGMYTVTVHDIVQAYSPSTGTWSWLAPLPQGRYGHSATLLANGRILVAGGSAGSGWVSTAWLYDPTADTWSPTGSLNQARGFHSATLLADGRVLLAGGGGVATAELYDPATGTFQTTGALGSSRYGHVAVRLADGRVLLAGGYGNDPLATAELYDPATGTFSRTGSLSVPRHNVSGTLLRDGRVLVAGGSHGTTPLATAELYNPVTGNFVPTGSMAVARSGLGLIALETGNVVVVGGSNARGTTGSTELYEPSTGTFRPLLPLQQARSHFKLVLLKSGKVLVAGGNTTTVELGPLNSAPVAHEASVTVAEDTQVAVTLSATDVDGEALQYELVRPPAHGTLSGQAPALTYVPEANYHGSDSFTFRVTDGKLFSSEATLSLTVTPVNDTPVALGGSVTTVEDTAVPVLLLGADLDGEPLTYTVVTGPAHGTLSGTPPRLVYTPARDSHGEDSFTFRVTDGKQPSAEATVSITVTPVNDAPVAESGWTTTDEDTAVPVVLPGTDADGDPLTYTVVTGPTHGTLSGTPPQLLYTPAVNASGSYSLTFRVSDGQQSSAEATFTLSVVAVNDTPVARSAQVKTEQGKAVELTLEGTDAEWGALTYTVVRGPAQGTLSGTPPRVTYTPKSGFAGEDSFTFTVTDAEGARSQEATLSLTVTRRQGGGGSGLGCAATGSEWPLGSLVLLLLGALRGRGRRGSN
jgi:N-acetylneuraminic acid mutarotase